MASPFQLLFSIKAIRKRKQKAVEEQAAAERERLRREQESQNPENKTQKK